MNETAHYLEELRRETAAQLDLVQELIAELDDLGDLLAQRVMSRPLELALELHRRLRQRECEIATDQLVCDAAWARCHPTTTEQGAA